MQKTIILQFGVRQTTEAILALGENCNAWEAIARECLSYMSEDDVKDMNRVAEFVTDEDVENAS